MKIEILPALKDNYIYILHGTDGKTAVIDPGDENTVIEHLDAQGISGLDLIINTHHHWDHTDGNIPLKQKYGCKIAGPAYEAERIEGLDLPIDETSAFSFGGEDIIIYHTPGHTAGHICLYLPDSKAVFTADTLFSMGCGRLFEGDANDLWTGFEKLRALPDNTMIYGGHEYTIANAKFCMDIEPENDDIKKHYQEVKSLRRNKMPTFPVSLKTEKQTNVFLRAQNVKELAHIRQLKDNS